MKNKFLLGILSLAIMLSMAGCGNLLKTSGTSETSLTGVEITFSEDEITLNGQGCSEAEGVVTITSGGTYILSGSSDSASVVVDTDDEVTIILNGVDLTSSEGPVIYGKQVKKLYIQTAEGTTNNLTDSDNYAVDSSTDKEVGKAAIFCEDDLVISGEGTLNVTGVHKHGVASNDEIYIESGEITITSESADGVNANDLISIDGGNITISAAKDAMECEEKIEINGGTINATSDGEGFESNGEFYINNGEITLNVEEDGLNSKSYIEINGGNINITCKTGDAIDCNANKDNSIVINGGYIYAVGGNMPEGALDADEANVLINGGTVIAIGDANSPISTDGKQVTVVYGSFEAGKKLEIKDSDGNTVFEIAPEVSGSTMIISTEGFEADKTYTIYADGTESYTFTVDSQVIEAGGNDKGIGGMGGPGGKGERPEGDGQFPGEPPEGFEGKEPPEGFDGKFPGEPPEGFDGSNSQKPSKDTKDAKDSTDKSN